ELDMLKDLRNLSIIISHYHPDHYADLLAIANSSYIGKKLGYLDKPIDVYLPDDGINQPNLGEWQTPIILPTDYQFLTDDRPNFMRFHKYDENSELEIDGLRVQFVQTPHEGESYAMKVNNGSETLVYSGDTAYDDNPLGEFALNADALICEATYLRGQDKGRDQHLYAYEAAKIAATAHVKDLYLYHTYPELDKSLYVDEASSIFPNTHSVEEGQIIRLEKRK
ncbi:MAG: MBL fold metallo-hydrolase, partial [Bacilli bacterium]|nr:MBL fold metallo-hydrolase [Bacilli bacterium]